ncbi:NtaA/DmoA family FMN-dependent monooxygenase [Nocardia higoensis]|uniref:NtaA/DmoA family FMN-dependent monooxygenase n=1 Tax=Nocardia higoensis TaxID=228599 RepID=UPI001C3F3DFF|nr:NtaA/DmoA family FMN-dependent monooxygenase [Nocardia higoensis]
MAHRSGLILSAFVMGAGHHAASWRHPDAPAGPAELTPEHYIELVKIAERGKLHSFFLADTLALSPNVALNGPSNLEPLVTLAALSQHTERIGLVATVSTAFYPPYHLARLINTLDHFSGGRFGWNVVTSTADREAHNFGREAMPAHDDRYRDAADFLEAITHLLGTWEPDAVVRDRESGRYLDLARIDTEPARFGGYSFGGPLDLPRSPQGKPVIVQAGRSPAGIEFAGRFAEVVFTVQQTFDEAKSFRDRLRASAGRAGRSPDEVSVLPGLWPFIGSTEAEAKKLYEDLEELVLPAQVAQQITTFTGLDLSGYGYDDVLPALPAEGFQGQQGRYHVLRNLIDNGQNTLRKLQKEFGTSRGHQVVIGTPEQIADSIVDWFDRGAVDGFSIQPPILPHGLDLFVDHVVPELQRRGVFHEDYDGPGRTFRDELLVAREAAAR